MKNQNPDRVRIFSHITRTRFLHLEDSLEIGKIRFFVGEYQRGQGSQATAYHFLDADDTRPLMADLSWSKATDFVDYKGSANGQQPISRVLKVKGPKDGKYWLEIQNGPGEIIGAGAVKPAGEPDASISIALTVWEARKMALAVTEYMAAYRVATLLSHFKTVQSQPGPPASHVPDQNQPATSTPVALDSGKKAEPAENKPTTFYALANEAIQAGLLATVQELIRAQCSWREKTARLNQAMMDATAA